MSETVWVLDPTESRPASRLWYHASPDCPWLRIYKARSMETQEAESEGYARCRRNGPCNSATNAGPRPGRNRLMVTAGKAIAVKARLPGTAAFHAKRLSGFEAALLLSPQTAGGGEEPYLDRTALHLCGG
jgi:hypothetical protein